MSQKKLRILRRSAAISPFGIGAMVPFPNNEVLMPASVERWPLQKNMDAEANGLIVRDNRLEARLRVTHFRLPPAEATEAQEAAGYYGRIPFVRFPAWYYCPRCGMMKRLSGTHNTPPKCTAPSGSSCRNILLKNRPTLIPSRFVAVCKMGHIQDLEYNQWVHGDAECHDSQLQIWSSPSSATMTGAMVECVTCKRKKNLMSALGGGQADGETSSYLKCQGKKPWENMSYQEQCGQRLTVMNRGASSVYFPLVIGSIYIPSANKVQDPLLEKLRENLFSNEESWETCLSEDGTTLIEENVRMWAKPRKFSDEEIASIINHCKAHLSGLEDKPEDCESNKEEHYRAFEYEALKRSVSLNDEKGAEALSLTKTDIDSYKSIVADNIQQITLVNKLRETRALVGFSRVRPSESNWLDKAVQRTRHRKGKWCPAVTAYGEGIFIELNAQKISKWAEQETVKGRARRLSEKYNSARKSRNPDAPERHISPAFVLLHTLSHALINQLVYECGYGSSSLRERLYCNLNHDTAAMCGTLIYTASGDSEGTLGGLVRQGRTGYLESTLINTLQRAEWCSSDPICIDLDGQGPDGANLAACHSCCLLPETSCEEGNRLLDRAMLIGTLNDPNVGFFKFKD
jgi:hypothetical protein